jgi:choline dehydrogenase
MDGSVFPTSIGANPQLSICALTAQNATALAAELNR